MKDNYREIILDFELVLNKVRFFYLFLELLEFNEVSNYDIDVVSQARSFVVSNMSSQIDELIILYRRGSDLLKNEKIACSCPELAGADNELTIS